MVERNGINGRLEKENYKFYLQECLQAFRSTVKSVPIGCGVCDRRVRKLSTGQDVIDYSLGKQLQFVKGDDKKGFFIYHRNHLNIVQNLPNGRAPAGARLMKCAEKLQKMPHSLDYINYGLAEAHMNSWSHWLSDSGKGDGEELQLHVTPLHVVLNLASDSTVLRLTQSANSVFKSLCKNNCPCKSKRGESGENKQETAAKI